MTVLLEDIPFPLSGDYGEACQSYHARAVGHHDPEVAISYSLLAITELLAALLHQANEANLTIDRGPA